MYLVPQPRTLDSPASDSLRASAVGFVSGVRKAIASWKNYAGERGRYSETQLAIVDRLTRSAVWPLPAAGLLAAGYLGHNTALDLVAAAIAAVTALPYVTKLRVAKIARSWNDALVASEPQRWIEPGFALAPDEFVVYHGPSQRFAERHLGFTPVHASKSSVFGQAIVGGVVGGGVGAMLGATAARYTGELTAQFGICAVDSGMLTMTSKRVVFIGKAETKIIERRNILGYRVSLNEHLVVDSPFRDRGESFTVNADIFELSMARRDPFVNYTPPVPPKPLPLTRGVLPKVITHMEAR